MKQQLFSIIIALVLAKLASVLVLLFNTGTINHGPDSNKVRKTIYQYGGNKYSFKPVVCICPTGLRK